MKRRPALVAFAFVASVTTLAEAHQDSVTHLRVTTEGRVVQATFRIEAVDLNEAMRAPPSEEVTRQRALASVDRVAEYLRARFEVTDAHARCAATQHAARTEDRRDTWDLVVTLTYACPHAVGDLRLRYGLFFDVDPRHQGMTSVALDGRETQHVFRDRTRELSIATERTLGRQVATYVALGVDHIFLGYDHVAFLAGLLLVVGARPLRRGAREVLAIVTAFTAAHSLTLLGAALGVVRVSPAIVEPAIALSIAFVAVENLLPREPQRRWALAFVFGLVHGFGFAGVLAEQGLPARGVVPSLLAFNVGVELGQLSLVAAALPTLALLGRERWRAGHVAVAVSALAAAWVLLARHDVPAAPLAAVMLGAVPTLALASRRWGYVKGVRQVGSAVLGALGIYWFVERIFGRSFLGGHLG